MSKINFKNIFLTLILCLFILSKTSYANVLSMDLYMDNKVVKYDASEVYIYINDILAETKEMPAIILNERTLVPAREVFEQMGSTVTWVQDTYEVIVEKNDIKITLKINSNEIKVLKGDNLETIEIDVPAKIINNKTMIPIRCVSEAMNATVEWIQSDRIVDIKYSDENIDDENIPSDINELDSYDEDKNNDDEKISSNESLYKEWNNKTKDIRLENKITNSYEKNNEVSIDRIITNYDSDDYFEITLRASNKITNVNVSEIESKLILDIDNAILNDGLTNSDNNTHVFSSNPSCANIYFGSHEGYLRSVITLKVKSARYDVTLSKDRKDINIKVYKNSINKITYEEKNDNATLTIEGIKTIDGKAKLLTDDYRLYIDINNISKNFGDIDEKISKSNMIKKIRVASYDNYARIVLDLNNLYDYETKKINDNTIQIKLSKLNFIDLDYTNSNEYKITINDKNLSKINVNKNVVVTEDYMNGIYEIDLGSDYEDEIGLDKLYTYDDMIDYFEIVNSKVKSKYHTIIKFSPKNHKILALDVNTNKNGLEIKILLPGEKYDEVLVLDAGHAKGNEGTNDKTYGGPSYDKVNVYYEEDLTLKIVDSAYEYLNDNSDIKVYLTRESNEKMNDLITNYNGTSKFINGRIQMENSIKADAFLSVHINSMDPNKYYDKQTEEVRDIENKYEKNNVTSYYGTEIIYNNKVNTTGKNYNGLSNLKFAEEIIDAFVEETDGSYFNNGEKELDYLNCRNEQINRTGVIRDGQVPGALLEVGVINNVHDHDLVINDDYLKECGKVIAKTLIKIFDKYKLNKN